MGRRWVETGGVRLAVYEDGVAGGPVVLLVHGYPDNASVWDGVVAELGERFRVVRYDVRGCGASGAPDGRDGYLMSALVGDLVAVVEGLGGGPVHLVAHDWGSIQSWAAVAARPELFLSFTSISGPDLGHIDAWMRGGGRRRDVGRQIVHSWYIGAFQVPFLPELVWRAPFLLRRFHARYRDARNGVELYRANMFGASRGAPRVISTPVQQLALVRDPFVTSSILTSADSWCERLWRRPLAAGHWAVRDRPSTVARLVFEFVDHVGGGAASRELERARVGFDRKRLGGQLALVTGAGSGIGRATALALREQGADVLCVDIDFDSATRTAVDVGGSAFQLDVSDGDATARLAEHVLAEHGVPDLVMANAGIAVAGSFLETSEDDWRRVIDVNLLGVVNTLRAFAPLLVDRGEGGHLVITSSAAGFLSLPSLPAYGASKAAVLMLAQNLAGELVDDGIAVSAICPGIVHTGITSSARFAGASPEEERELQVRATASYRRRGFGPEKVAAAVVATVLGGRSRVVPVTPEAKVGAIANRVAPRATRALLRWFDRVTASRQPPRRG
ncbi:SDR family oxidoreductase [Actinophytocola oryzae]|uniref:NADP-dependent 3-hydroxy acid dehydrogenase YdfG n=1 Tax=Actinophytocola oryzae TaxID=502181 RepID=A0A4R7VVC1_9PSEU|nr:SDR family oxidoreductase [Actinophytocola oryzae]TDV53960.1 NADP-dependent 3-hydroxy acid dehydrogenase YdfG [Actinophytocola oryzae]